MALIATILHQIGGLATLGSTYREIVWIWCLAGALAALLHIVLSGVNIWILLRAANSSLPFFQFIELYIYSYCFSLILPGQTGDLTISLFLRKHGVPLKISTACYFADKLITLVFMLLVGAYGFTVLIPDAPAWLIFTGGICAIGAGLFVLQVIARLKNLLGPLKRIQEMVLAFNQTLSVLGKAYRSLALNVIVTIVNWGLVGFSYFLVFKALNTEVAWPMVGVIPIMSTFVGYLPISIGGVGTVEYSAIYLFGLIGAPQAVVLATYLLQRAIQFALVGVLLLLLFLLKRARISLPESVPR